MSEIEPARRTRATVTKAPPRLMDEAYEIIESMIVTGTLKPGSWVSESLLCEASGYGRAPVRAAIQRLAQQQLITIHPRRGARVCEVDFTLQFRALELRRVVERLLTACAARRASPEQRQTFDELSKEFTAAAETQDQARSTRADRQLFNLLIIAADNPFAATAMASVTGLTRRFWIINHEKHGSTAAIAQAYSDVAAAIASGSPEQAEKATDALIDYVESVTLSVVGYADKRT